MTVDYSKFAFPNVEDPHASTLTDAIRVAPVDEGFVVVTIKLVDPAGYEATLRMFAQAIRAHAEQSGLQEVTAYREFRPDEWGGAVPFDQSIIEKVVDNARERAESQSERYPTIRPALKMVETNDIADYTLLLKYATKEQAAATVSAWTGGDAAFNELTADATNVTFGAFQNMFGYASVSRDPNVIQFFNFFPGPGDADALWKGWQDALPWFFEVGAIRSSFPLKALDPEQSLLVINYAHFNSVKEFFLGVAYDPNYLEVVESCYVNRGFKLPMPFFCKIIPV